MTPGTTTPARAGYGAPGPAINSSTCARTKRTAPATRTERRGLCGRRQLVDALALAPEYRSDRFCVDERRGRSTRVSAARLAVAAAGALVAGARGLMPEGGSDEPAGRITPRGGRVVEMLAARARGSVLRRRVWQSSSMSDDATPESPSETIDAIIEQLNDWRGELLSQIRELIKQAEPDVVEEIKWQKPSNPLGVPVWTRDGILCTGETYKDKVKVTFAKGASLEDAAGLFNASLDGKVRRAIDLGEGEGIDDEAFKALVRAAAKLNAS